MEKEFNNHVTRVRRTVFSDKDLSKHADDVRKVVKDPLERLMCSVRFKRTFTVCLILAVGALSGCSKATNRAIGNFIGSAGQIVSSGLQDVGDGVASIGEERN